MLVSSLLRDKFAKFIRGCGMFWVLFQKCLFWVYSSRHLFLMYNWVVSSQYSLPEITKTMLLIWIHTHLQKDCRILIQTDTERGSKCIYVSFLSFLHFCVTFWLVEQETFLLYLQTKRNTRNNPCKSNGSVKTHGASGGQPGSDQKWCELRQVPNNHSSLLKTFCICLYVHWSNYAHQ